MVKRKSLAWTNKTRNQFTMDDERGNREKHIINNNIKVFILYPLYVKKNGNN